VSPRVAVIVVNYNGRAHLAYCLPSLLATAYENYSILLVDNASSDDSVALVQADFPAVEIVRNRCNVGWAGGNNVGVRLAVAHGAEYVVLQNNDTRVDPRWLSAAVEAFEAHPRLGVLGFAVLGEYRADEDPDGTRFDAQVAAAAPAELVPTAHVSGCALAVRAQVFRDVGLFDERYFVFAEEDDFVARALAAGYERARVTVPVWHAHGGTWRRTPLRFSYLAMRNDLRFILKNEPPVRAVLRLGWTICFVLAVRPRYDRALSHYRRLRPGCWPVNAGLLFGAVAWNLVSLPETLMSRRRDRARAMAARPRVAVLPETPLPSGPASPP
jgi:GT2 family glycosyltransferase